MSDGRIEGKTEGETSAQQPGHRFGFGRRWERKKRSRSLKKAWMVLLLDLALLLIISLMAWMLAQRLNP
jgi:hypothetical protein